MSESKARRIILALTTADDGRSIGHDLHSPGERAQAEVDIHAIAETYRKRCEAIGGPGNIVAILDCYRASLGARVEFLMGLPDDVS